MEIQTVPQLQYLVAGHLLDLVGGVAGLEALTECPAFHGLGQDDGGLTLVLGGRLVGRVHLLVVVTAAGQIPQVLVGQVLDQLAQPGVRPEEVLPDVGPVLHRVALELAVDRGVHLVEQHAVDVALEQLVPAATPDDFDDVPSGAPEHALQLLDDLAVAPDRTVESLEVAVDDPGQVVESAAAGQRDGAERLGLVGLAVAQKRPHSGVLCVVDPPALQVFEEAGVVDGVDRTEAHRHRRVLPEIGHEPGVWVARQSVAADLEPEVVEVGLVEPALHERPGVDTRCGVALEVNGVAGHAVFLTPEEPVEANLVERGRRRERRQVTADAVGLLVGPDDHRRRIPSDEGPDPSFDVFVTGEERLLLGGDGVHVVGRDTLGVAQLEFAGVLVQPAEKIAGPGLTRRTVDGLQGFDPFGGLLGVDVG